MRRFRGPFTARKLVTAALFSGLLVWSFFSSGESLLRLFQGGSVYPAQAAGVTINTGPANPVRSTAATFSFTPVSGVQCQLDGGSFVPCTSPQTYTGITPGAHTFVLADMAMTSTATWNWTVPPIPTITSLSPATAVAGGASFTLTVNGTNFVSGFSSVRWNGTVRTTTFVTTTQLRATILAADLTTSGVYNVRVDVTNGGTDSSNDSPFSVDNGIPVVSSLSPTSGTAAGAGFTLTVNGSKFVNGAVVRWNGSDRTTTFVNATRLTAAIPASDIATGGTAAVSVFNPAPGGGASGDLTFTINNPVPTFVSFLPASATVGGSGFTLVINGTKFFPSSVVSWNGVDRATTYVSATRVSVPVTAPDIATVGPVSIVIVNPAPGGGTVNPTFWVNNPVAIISSISPTTIPAGGADFTLAVNGSNFVSGAKVRWNGADRSTTYLSPTQLTAVIAAADIAASGTASVTTFNPTPGGGSSGSKTFTITVATNPAPSVSSLSPASSVAGSAGPVLTVYGSGFFAGSVFRWNGSDRPTTYVNFGEIRASLTDSDIATAATDTYSVFNPTPGGGTFSGSYSVFNPFPSLTSISPASVIAGGSGFILALGGSDFVAGSQAIVNGLNRSATFVSPTQLDALVSAAEITDAGTVPVQVFNPGPGGGTSATQWLAVDLPTAVLDSVSPTAVTAGGAAFTLQLNGSNFMAGHTVLIESTSLNLCNFFGGDPWCMFNPVSKTLITPTSMTAAVPANYFSTAGILGVAVETPGSGGSTYSVVRNVTVNNPAPTLSSIDPVSATVGDPDLNLTVNGTNFVLDNTGSSASIVRWNATPLVTTRVSPTQLQAVLPASAMAVTGTGNVMVRSEAPGGGDSTSLVFTVSNPVPTITSIDPVSVTAGAPGLTLTVNGTNFLPSSVVRWNNTADLVTTYASPTRLAAAIPAAAIASAKDNDVSVFSPGGAGVTSANVTFVVESPVVTPPAPSGDSGNVTGWLWSRTAGWISMNCGNFGTCSLSNYGVNLQEEDTGGPTTKASLTGYGWSDDLGWVCFGKTCPGLNPEGLVNYAEWRVGEKPADPANHACLTSYDCSPLENCGGEYVCIPKGRFYGWAKVMNLGNSGWISLNCDNDVEKTCGTSDHFIVFDQGKFTLANGWPKCGPGDPQESCDQLAEFGPDPGNYNWAWSGNDDGTGLGWIDTSLVFADWAPPALGRVARPEGIYEPDLPSLSEEDKEQHRPSKFQITVEGIYCAAYNRMVCEIGLPNGETRSIGRDLGDMAHYGDSVTLEYTVTQDDALNGGIQQNTLWMINACRLTGKPIEALPCSKDIACPAGKVCDEQAVVAGHADPGFCRKIIASTLKKPIYVHSNRWTLFNDNEDYYQAIKCYAGFPGQFFRNSARCDFTGDASLSLAMSKGVPVRRDCHGLKDSRGEPSCDDRFCGGISYFCTEHEPTRCIWSQAGGDLPRCSDINYARGGLCCSAQPVESGSGYNSVVNGLECVYQDPQDGYFDCDCTGPDTSPAQDCYAPYYQPGDLCCAVNGEVTIIQSEQPQ